MAKNIDVNLAMFDREEEEKYTKSLAKNLGFEYVDLLGYLVTSDTLSVIPEETSEQYNIVSYIKTSEVVKIATTDPDKEKLKPILDEIQKKTGLKTVLVLCSKGSLSYIQRQYQLAKKEKEVAEKVKVEKITEDKFAQKIHDLEELKERIGEVPTTQLLELIFTGAVASEASDIHLEPAETELRVRYRIDGVLQDVVKLPKTAERVLNSRIKYMSKLKLDIKDKPQDGRLDVTAAGIAIDIRVSLIPSAFGETIVMRLLPKEKKFITLEALGFRPEYIKIIEQQIKKPNGIIFNTGPTGSGKTTTNYAVLDKLNQPGVKIITLEDPIEYKISGIQQSQVEEERNYTFASGLRSILRQDPDIIMVGEIRDEETATIAMQAAMTGHLVLTTLHTNSASVAIPRLMDMGVKPYLLSGSINLIIAQRLVRKIHQDCKGKGCKICNMTGFKGRIAIAELLVPDQKIEKLILRNATIAEFETTAHESGMMSMYEDGMDKVSQGLTTKEEILRVTQG